MDNVQKSAYITAQSACLQAEVAAMQQQNTEDTAAGRRLTYAAYDFMGLIDKYGLGHNAVLTYLQDY